MNRLAGKVALVLGAAGRDNIAQEIARRFVSEGAQVVVTLRGNPGIAEVGAAVARGITNSADA